MDKIVFLLPILFSVSAVAETEKYTCENHPHYLSVTSVGHEHVNHMPYLNGSILITELEQGSWFIEKVVCTNSGFAITASHIQYGDQTTQTFDVYITNSSEYEIE